MCVTFDLFNAGFDTTSNMLRWVILYMAKYPEVQRRVQQQLDEVVPRDTLPSYEHKPKYVTCPIQIQFTSINFNSSLLFEHKHHVNDSPDQHN